MFTTRPELLGTFGVVATTHWLASSAGMAMLEKGGNAFDAAVAAGFVAGALLGARLVPHVPEGALRLAFGSLLLYLGLLFVFNLRPSHPAGLVLAPVAAVAGWVTRRLRGRPTQPEPPAEEHEYYI